MYVYIYIYIYIHVYIYLDAGLPAPGGARRPRGLLRDVGRQGGNTIIISITVTISVINSSISCITVIIIINFLIIIIIIIILIMMRQFPCSKANPEQHARGRPTNFQRTLFNQ